MDNLGNVSCHGFLIKTPAVTTVCHLLEDHNFLSIVMLKKSPSLALKKHHSPFLSMILLFGDRLRTCDDLFGFNAGRRNLDQQEP